MTPAPPAPALEVTHLKKRFGGLPATKDVSLSVMPGERQTVRALLDTIPRDVTIVMIEHDMDTALAFAERITVLHYGQVIVEGTRAEVVADPRTKEVYLGE